MTTSGSYSFSLNMTQIITRAFNKINVYDVNATVESDDYALAADTLNMMIKDWENDGVRCWKRRQATLFPVLNQYSYQLGSVSGADNCTNSYVKTTIANNVGSGTGTIVVTSATGLVNGMFIGLEQDDQSRIWGTITNISGTTITCSFTTTTTSTASNLNTVVAYTSLINRPLRVLRATLCDLKSNNSEVTMGDFTYDEYFNLPIKNQGGRPNNWYYDKVLDNGLPYTGTLYVFPSPSATSQVINFTYYDSIQDMLLSNNTVDFPQEWTRALVLNLACELAEDYGKQIQLQTLQPRADRALLRAQRNDDDDESLQLSVNNDPHSAR